MARIDFRSSRVLMLILLTALLQMFPPKGIAFNSEESQIISSELDKLLTKGFIVKSQHCHGEFLSTIFLRKKKTGGYRLILNLKNLNQYISNHHFKMESLTSAILLMTPGCYMASVDLQDAYYSVPINEKCQKYLKFSWQGELFQFTCLPNGLASAPRLFTKLLKPVYSKWDTQMWATLMIYTYKGPHLRTAVIMFRTLSTSSSKWVFF